MRRLVTIGAVSGLAGGAASAIVLLVAGEGPIGRAIALESATHSGEAGAELYGRGAQQLGGVLAALILGAALGCLFAVAFAAVRPRLRDAAHWTAPLRLAAVGFAAIFLMPFLKYPSDPPGVGDPETIARRTALYIVAVGWSLVASWAGWRLWRHLGRRGVADHLRGPASVGAALALAGLGLTILPAGTVLPGGTVLPAGTDAAAAPATLVWHFRTATAAGAVAMWAVIGTTFSWLLAIRAERPALATAAPRSAEPAEAVDAPRP